MREQSVWDSMAWYEHPLSLNMDSSCIDCNCHLTLIKGTLLVAWLSSGANYKLSLLLFNLDFDFTWSDLDWYLLSCDNDSAIEIWLKWMRLLRRCSLSVSRTWISRRTIQLSRDFRSLFSSRTRFSAKRSSSLSLEREESSQTERYGGWLTASFVFALDTIIWLLLQWMPLSNCCKWSRWFPPPPVISPGDFPW